MCATCGCGPTSEHHHTHEHGHDHHHETAKRTISVEQDILHQNNLLAERNRGYFEAKNIFTMNMVSSPGSGKTTLLERTLTELRQEFNFCVIEGTDFSSKFNLLAVVTSLLTEIFNLDKVSCKRNAAS